MSLLDPHLLSCAAGCFRGGDGHEIPEPGLLNRNHFSNSMLRWVFRIAATENRAAVFLSEACTSCIRVSLRSSLGRDPRRASLANALIERNVIDVGVSNRSPVRYWKSGVVQTARNQTFAGLPVPGVDSETRLQSDDLAARVAAAEILSLL